MDHGPANRTGVAAAIVAGVAALLLIAVVFGLGPCADEKLGVAEYVSRGDDVCTQAHTEFLDLQSGTPGTAAEAAELIGALIEVAEEEQTALAELTPPSRLVESVGRYLDARDRGIDRLRDGLRLAKKEDAGGYEAIQDDLTASQGKRWDLARAVGFRECSKPLVR